MVTAAEAPPSIGYLSAFGLRVEPFSHAPMGGFYFPSRAHVQAFERLKYGAEAMKGLVLLVGDVGHGKTTVARRLLDALPEARFEAVMLVVLNGDVTPQWFLHRLAVQLGIANPDTDKINLISQLYKRLVALHQAGRRVVVFVDEVQLLKNPEVLEEFRCLLNLETPQQKLITFIFSGLPEVEANLQQVPPLAQRVAVRVRLMPMSAAETAEYVEHRLRLAGATRPLFDDAALLEVYRATGGVPRVINTLCDNALFELFLLNQTTDAASDMTAALGQSSEAQHTSGQVTAQIVKQVRDALALPAPLMLQPDMVADGGSGLGATHQAVIPAPPAPLDPAVVTRRVGTDAALPPEAFADTTAERIAAMVAGEPLSQASPAPKVLAPPPPVVAGGDSSAPPVVPADAGDGSAAGGGVAASEGAGSSGGVARGKSVAEVLPALNWKDDLGLELEPALAVPPIQGTLANQTEDVSITAGPQSSGVGPDRGAVHSDVPAPLTIPDLQIPDDELTADALSLELFDLDAEPDSDFDASFESTSPSAASLAVAGGGSAVGDKPPGALSEAASAPPVPALDPILDGLDAVLEQAQQQAERDVAAGTLPQLPEYEGATPNADAVLDDPATVDLQLPHDFNEGSTGLELIIDVDALLDDDG